MLPHERLFSATVFSIFYLNVNKAQIWSSGSYSHAKALNEKQKEQPCAEYFFYRLLASSTTRLMAAAASVGNTLKPPSAFSRFST